MQAIIFTEYGSPDVLQCAEIEKPAPARNEILIRVYAASINPLDFHNMRGSPCIIRLQNGLRRPKNPRLGVDLSGEVEAVGQDVTDFRPGDAVFGVRTGALAEYVITTGKAFAPIPSNLTFEQAAVVPVAGLTALQGLRDKGKLQPGQTLLVNGAAGGVGTFAVQIARAIGAEITAVTSTPNLELVRSLGAHHVVDYTRENFTRSGQRYDLIFDGVGNHPLSACRRILKPDGTYIMVGGSGGGLFGPLLYAFRTSLMSRFVSQNLLWFLSSVHREDLLTLKDMIESGQVTPVIDRRYTLCQTPEAMRYLETGHARAKLVINVTDEWGGQDPDESSIVDSLRPAGGTAADGSAPARTER